MSTSTPVDVADAYVECERITREQARNFYYGIRLLPGPKREALCAIYALSRRIDDIGDGDLPPEQKLARLAEVREQLRRLDAPELESDPVLLAVAETCQRFPVPVSAFTELVDGVEMDVRGASYDSFEELVQYCRYVAGTIGRLCLGVFGPADDADAPANADALGVALQQVNILRDIREDLLNGRIYLPRHELADFGVELSLDSDGRLADPQGRLSSYVRFCADRASSWYTQGEQLLPVLDRRSRSCCAAMAGIYRHLLARIAAEPSLVFGGRLSLSGLEKGRIAARALAGALT